jgi:hypothetical protein
MPYGILLLGSVYFLVNDLDFFVSLHRIPSHIENTSVGKLSIRGNIRAKPKRSSPEGYHSCQTKDFSSKCSTNCKHWSTSNKSPGMNTFCVLRREHHMLSRNSLKFTLFCWAHSQNRLLLAAQRKFRKSNLIVCHTIDFDWMKFFAVWAIAIYCGENRKESLPSS